MKKPAGAAATSSGARKPGVAAGKAAAPAAVAAAAGSTKQRGWAPPLKPATYLPGSVALKELKSSETSTVTAEENIKRRDVIRDLFHKVLGQTPTAAHNLSAPRVATSTTLDRSGAAADLAVIARDVTGVRFLLKDCGLYEQTLKLLFPTGIESVIKDMPMDSIMNNNSDAANNTTNNNSDEVLPPSGIKPSRSAISLTSMDDATTGSGSIGFIADDTTTVISDSRRGKTTPAEAREGCYLLIRALCEIVVGKSSTTTSSPVEPYVVGALLASALDECGSGNGAVRQAAQDCALAICQIANPWSFPSILRPLLLQTLLNTTEWRIKAAALECFEHCAKTKSAVVQKLIPKLLPPMVSQVWDTKPQVSKAAKSALLAVCMTNANPDVKKTIPAVVNAICKPSETNKAMSELMGTTFVVPVDASTLAILCPVLARALKEKLAIHKRSACLVISNMSKLVERPEAVAPFGSLLVPELQKVCDNVQFEEIREEGLKALANLSKALGDSFKVTEEAEQKRIQQQQQ